MRKPYKPRMERVHSDTSLDDLLKAFFPDLAHGCEYAYRPVRVRETGILSRFP